MSATATVPPVPVDLVRLGVVVREARRAIGDPSQEDIGKAAGISQNAWSRIERGANKEVELGQLDAVAQVLGLTLQELLARAGIIRSVLPTREAILSDPDLADVHRQPVLDVYDGFVRLSEAEQPRREG